MSEPNTSPLKKKPGRKPGFHCSATTRKKISDAAILRHATQGHPSLGTHHSAETIKKMSDAQIGIPCPKRGQYPRSKEDRKRISEKTKLQIASKGHPASGTHRSKESRLKMSERRIKFLHSEEFKNNPSWMGKRSFERYCIDWTETLRKSIRERDRYTCKICGNPQGDLTHCIHHIDYDKTNCSPSNLITLCHSCHIKTNQNRNYWRQYFGT